VVERYSALFITLAAALWASDAYFRPALVKDGLSSSQIVLLEDLLITLCLLPVARTVVRELRSASWKTWLALFIIAAGPQAFATVLFTRSLSYATSRGAQGKVSTVLRQMVGEMLCSGDLLCGAVDPGCGWKLRWCWGLADEALRVG